MTKADAEAIAAWRYRGRYSTYDVGEIVTSARGSVAHETELVGYCCFGPEARVPGIDEEEGTLDTGYGMLPDLVGQGFGRAFVAAILNFAVNEFSPQRLRLLISAGTSAHGRWPRRSASNTTGLRPAPREISSS